jgi:hypothetical protein
MGNPNCCFMIIAGTFFFSSQSPRGTVKCQGKNSIVNKNLIFKLRHQQING